MKVHKMKTAEIKTKHTDTFIFLEKLLAFKIHKKNGSR